MSGFFRTSAWGFFYVLCLTIIACQSGPAPRETYYQLEPEIQQGPPDPKACGTLLVGRLGTHGFAGGRAIVFRERADSLEIQRYHYNLWSEAPALMIQQAIARSLRATGLLRYVITPVERANADWIVSGSLLRLEHFPNSSPASVVFEVELGIVSAKSRETLFLKRYLETESAANNNIGDAVKAFNNALEQMLAQFQKDAGKILALHRASCE
ncbi:MAG: ABC-type transport auxiliary lipoprotein family protein [Methylococcaceae bacterium]|nr:ABC-type transport auxiliary lipoprotein family protein [Methylococcaceae bacterium]